MLGVDNQERLRHNGRGSYPKVERVRRVKVTWLWLCLFVTITALCAGCGQGSKQDPLKVTAIVRPMVDSGFSDGMFLPGFSVELTLVNTSRREVKFDKLDVILVNKHADMASSRNTFPGGKVLRPNESYPMDTVVPLTGGGWESKVNLLVHFPGQEGVLASRFVQLPDAISLATGNCGPFDLPAQYGTTSFDSEGNVVK